MNEKTHFGFKKVDVNKMKKELLNHFDYIKKFNSDQIDKIEDFKIKYLGRKGIINDLFSKFKDVPAEDKREIGLKINELKNSVQNKYDDLINKTKSNQRIVSNEDISRPGFPIGSGSLHPITIIKNGKVYRNRLPKNV